MNLVGKTNRGRGGGRRGAQGLWPLFFFPIITEERLCLLILTGSKDLDRVKSLKDRLFQKQQCWDIRRHALRHGRTAPSPAKHTHSRTCLWTNHQLHRNQQSKFFIPRNLILSTNSFLSFPWAKSLFNRQNDLWKHASLWIIGFYYFRFKLMSFYLFLLK